MLEVYLAGPEVFYPDAIEIGARKKTICRKYGFVGLFPLDKEIHQNDGPERAAAIYEANLMLLGRADFVIANLSPFRGPSMDPGTAFEVGYAVARGIPIFGYTNDNRLMVGRVLQSIGGRDEDVPVDAEGLEIENYGFVENLMIEVPIRANSGEVVRPGPRQEAGADLSTFEKCVVRAAKHLKHSSALRA